MIFYEETQVEGQPIMCKGKCCWFDAAKIKQDAPQFLFLFAEKFEDKSKLLLLKAELIKQLKKKGFVFFDDDKTVYRYMLSNSGKLKSFSVNYHYIT